MNLLTLSLSLTDFILRLSTQAWEDLRLWKTLPVLLEFLKDLLLIVLPTAFIILEPFDSI